MTNFYYSCRRSQNNTASLDYPVGDIFGQRSGVLCQSMAQDCDVTTDGMRYGFGENWEEFIQKHFSEERVMIAQDRLLSFLKLKDLRGKSFLDVGCGSGIHSLGAYRAGAESIVSFDYDPDSVRTTETVREYAGSPTHWKVIQGSVLDSRFVGSLDRADIVYSWGVLHHTGELWRALENAVSTMREDSVLFIALYTSDIQIDPPPEYCLGIKQQYNRAGSLGRKRMEWAYAWRLCMGELRGYRNPLKYIREYQQHRGMSFWTNIKDWLGGWPMEFASIAETRAFCSDKLGLELLHINAVEANTEYLFRKKDAKNYWDDFRANQKVEPLTGPYIHKRGHAWIVSLKHHADTADTIDHPRRSRVMLFENDVPMGLAHALHIHIQAYGGSRYSHWGDLLIFSTTDNTDPNINGRRYSICPMML